MPNTTTAADALQVLERFGAKQAGIAPQVFDVLTKQRDEKTQSASSSSRCVVTNLVIGNNATAVDAAGLEAERLGYSHAMDAATKLEGAAEQIGRHLAEMAVRMRSQAGPDCLITGGEPTVTLAPEERRGRGGRNQQLVLAAAERLLELDAKDGIVVLSGGTDGEDGPTDAAGAIADGDLLHQAANQKIAVTDALARNDAYTYFDARQSLIRTGPTHTNVCDIRVAVVERIETDRENR